MIITYDEILKKMKGAFFEHCKEPVADFGDISARLEAAASELFSLACESNFVLRQAFPQSATGEYLDFHAELRDIQRKTAAKAEGELSFFVSEAAQQDILIPVGVICSKEGEPYIQFVTTEEAYIPRGETSVTVKAQALENGWEYNAQENSVTVMVNPPESIDSVTNAAAFYGGSGNESDDALRKRILASYRIAQSGFSLNSLREGILKNKYITDCRLYYLNNEIKVLLRLKPEADFEAIENEVADELAIAKLTNSSVNVIKAVSSNYSLSVEIKTDESDTEALAQRVKACLGDFASGVLLDEDIYLNELAKKALSVDGVSSCEVSSPQAGSGIIVCPVDSFLSLSSITVNCHE